MQTKQANKLVFITRLASLVCAKNFPFSRLAIFGFRVECFSFNFFFQV